MASRILAITGLVMASKLGMITEGVPWLFMLQLPVVVLVGRECLLAMVDLACAWAQTRE